MQRQDEQRWVNRLETWFATHQRQLPWRQTRDPYAIWISEVMLQQTQVATAIPYYTRFLEKWPTLKALAESDESAVLAVWSGLGYYSRARNLRRGAQYLSESHGGHFPREVASLLKTPGIGPYTAGAILSIAFEEPAPIVDGNVQRVFARFYGVHEPIQNRDVQKRFWHWAAQWVSLSKSPRLLNQGLMELGATLCAKTKPKCPTCPLAPGCFAHQNDKTDAFPVRAPRRAIKELWWVPVVLERRGKLLLKQNPKGQWWQDLWDFPVLEMGSKTAIRTARQTLSAHYPGTGTWTALAPHKHTVTHHRIHVHPFVATIPDALAAVIPKRIAEPSKWWPIADLSEAPTSSLVKKIMRAFY